MRVLTSLLLLIVFASCSLNKSAKEAPSNWIGIKDSFLFRELTNFLIDTSLANDYFNRAAIYQDFLKPKDSTLDSILMTKQYLLYSWQKSTPSFTGFTVLLEGIGEALELRYLIFDKNNKLISNFIVAHKGGEPGGHKYEMQSILKSNDTIISTKTRTYLVDQKTLQKLSQPVADTIYFRQIIDENGKVQMQSNDTIMTTLRYHNENGWVTQDMIDKYNTKKHYR